jgi:hypothetical protein
LNFVANGVRRRLTKAVAFLDLLAFMLTIKLSADKIAELVGVPASFVKKIKASLQQKLQPK